MSGLGEQLNGLSAVRAECQKRRAELEAVGRRVEGYFRQHDQAVGEIALGSLDSALRGQRGGAWRLSRGPGPTGRR